MELPHFVMTKELPVATVAQVRSALQTVFSTLAEQADAELHYTRRPDIAEFSASTLIQTLVLGWLAHPDASLPQLAQTAARVGVFVRPQAIDQRFSFQTATLLRTVLVRSVEQLIAGDPVAIPVLRRFSGCFVHDSTTIVLPDELADHARGNGGATTTNTSAALKCGLQLDLLSGALCQLDLADGRAHDQKLPLQHAPLPPGALRLADLGFYDTGVFAELSAQGVYWLSKLPSSAVLSEPGQPPRKLLEFVRALGAFEQWEGEVILGSKQLAARLLVQRVPQEVADQRRRRIRAAARDRGQTPSAASLELAAWTILLTNCPAELLSLEEALVVAKVRWQIELVFKLWKSYGQVDKWRSKKPARVLCELYAKLLAMLVQQWFVAMSCWGYPERSLVKAAQAIREHAAEVASAQLRAERLEETLETMCEVLKQTARMNSRRKRPNTYQLLLALNTEEEEMGSEPS